MNDVIDLKCFFKYLWNRKKIVIYVFLVVIIFANLFQFAFSDFKYSNIGRIRISTPATSEKLIAYKDYLLSDEIIDNAIKKSNINSNKTEIKQNLYISAIIGSSIYEITLNYYNKNDGNKICQSIINEFIDYLEMYDGSSAFIYENVVTSSKPIDFNLIKNELSFFFVGTALAVGYVVIIYCIDNKIKGEGELTNYKVLGTINKTQKNLSLIKTKIKLCNLGNVLFLNTAKDINCKEEIYDLVEEFSKDAKVLFIDTNIRENKSTELGYSDILNNYKEDISKYVKNNKKFDIMESGTNNNKTDELLFSKNNEKLIENLKKKYDYVILYNSNVVDYSDSLILSKLCDCNYMLVGINQTNKKDLEKAIEVYKQVNNDVNGIIIIEKV